MRTGRRTRASSSKQSSCACLSLSILRHIGVNFVRPGADAAFDVFEVLETLLAQKFERLHRTDAALAVDVILLVRVQLGEPLCQRAERNERHTVDACDLV